MQGQLLNWVYQDRVEVSFVLLMDGSADPLLCVVTVRIHRCKKRTWEGFFEMDSKEDRTADFSQQRFSNMLYVIAGLRQALHIVKNYKKRRMKT
jgi:hypothetical protein